jgi:hypothetical protein
MADKKLVVEVASCNVKKLDLKVRAERRMGRPRTERGGAARRARARPGAGSAAPASRGEAPIPAAAPHPRAPDPARRPTA